MSAIEDILKDSKKLVVKIGSNVLSDENGVVNKETLGNIVKQVNTLRQMGKHVVIVSSGAGICGVGALNKWARRNDINYKQALCAIGQVELMMAYKEYFKNYGVHVGQILITKDDIEDNARSLNIRNALFTLVDEGVVPIVNENDSVSVEEIKIGDNDTLSAYTASLWNADTLIILSDIDGVFNKNPKTSSDAMLIEEVADIDCLLEKIDVEGKSSFGTGGIICKIEAARVVNAYNVPLVLLNGKKENIIENAMNGEATGTVFLGHFMK